jgi:SAM-dependent methyltransferase
MPEMNSFSRYFVNLSASRRANRNYRWVRAEAPIPPGARCLEIGCGNGELARRIVDGFQPAEYVATDVDPRQVEDARKNIDRRYDARPPASLLLRQSDMLGLPDADASFDVVLAFVALHHASPTHHDASRLPRALSELDRVLRPGGLLIYQEFLHLAAIRGWLADHGYSIERTRRRWKHESIVARKTGARPR